MMFDLRNVQSEESLLKDISIKVDELLHLVRKYIVYKIVTAKNDVTCGNLATETNDIHELLKALTIYKESIDE